MQDERVGFGAVLGGQLDEAEAFVGAEVDFLQAVPVRAEVEMAALAHVGRAVFLFDRAARGDFLEVDLGCRARRDAALAGDVDDVIGRDGKLITRAGLAQFGVDFDRPVRRDAKRGEEDDVFQRDRLAAELFPERADGNLEMRGAGQQRIAAVEVVLAQGPSGARR